MTRGACVGQQVREQIHVALQGVCDVRRCQRGRRGFPARCARPEEAFDSIQEPAALVILLVRQPQIQQVDCRHPRAVLVHHLWLRAEADRASHRDAHVLGVRPGGARNHGREDRQQKQRQRAGDARSIGLRRPLAEITFDDNLGLLNGEISN